MARSYSSFDYYWDDGVPGGVTSALSEAGYSFAIGSFSSYGKIYHGIDITGYPAEDPGGTILFELLEEYGAYAGSVLTSGEWYTYG